MRRREFLKVTASYLSVSPVAALAGNVQNVSKAQPSETGSTLINMDDADPGEGHKLGVGLGCMGMSEFYGPVNQAAVNRALLAASDLGVTLLDTADMYGNGENERLVGQTLRSHPSLRVATKFGIVREGQNWRVDNRPDYVRSACEASLRRLGVDSIDLYYVHRINPSHPIEETIDAMVDLIRQGKIRAIGLSEAAPATIRRAHSRHPITAVETEYSLLSREPERDVLPTCAELGIRFVPYAPLSRGMLTGSAYDSTRLAETDFRKNLPRFQPENFAFNSRLVDGLVEFANQRGCTSSQVALAWLLSKGPDFLPIPGCRSIRHLAENMAAPTIVLSADELSELDRLFPIAVAAGKRYSDAELLTVGL